MEHESNNLGSGKVSSLGPLVRSDPKPCFELGSCLFSGSGIEGESGKPNVVEGIRRA